MDRFRAEAALEHKSKILDSYSKMKDAGLLLDFNIGINNRLFPVHRSLLAAGSDYFQAMFLHDKKVVEQGVVEIKEVDIEPMSRCIEFLYTGDTDINNENCQDILHVSSILQIDALKKLCFRFLQTNLSSENCLVVAHLAEIYNDFHARTEAKKKVVDNFEVIVTMDLFSSISRSDLIYYLDKSRVDSQVSWSALTTWIRTNRDTGDEEDRTKVLDDALKVMKLPIPFLLSTVLDDDIIDHRTMIKLVSKFVFINTENLKENITASNSIKLKTLAKEFLDIDGKPLELINQFIADNIDEVSKYAGYEAFTEDTVEELEAKMNNCVSDKVKYELLLAWTRFEGQRRTHFSRLFKFIKLNELPIKFIQQKIKKEKLVEQSPSCSALLVHHTCLDSNDKYSYIEYDDINCTIGLGKFLHDDEFKFVSEEDLKIYLKSYMPYSEDKWEAMKRWMENKNDASTLFKDLLTVMDAPFEFLLNIVVNDTFFDEYALKEIALCHIFSSISKEDELCDIVDLNNCFILKTLNAQFNKVNHNLWNSEIERFLTIHAPLVLKRKEILNFGEDEIENLIRVTECSADDKAEVILKWVKQNSGRIDSFPGLFKNINLRFLSSPTIRLLLSDPIVSQLEDFYEILQNLGSERLIAGNNSFLEKKIQDLFVVDLLSGMGYICDLSSAETFVLPQTEKNSPINIINIGENVYGINFEEVLKRNRGGNWDCLSLIPETIRRCFVKESIYGLKKIVAFKNCLAFVIGSKLTMYIPSKGKWTDTLPGCDLYPKFCVAASEESIYALNGQMGRAKRFDVTASKWSDIAKIPTWQDSDSCAVLNNMVFLAGGVDLRNNPIDIVQCYNQKSDCWTKISNMCHPRIYLSTCAVNNKLYVTGGKKDGGFSIELYDEENNQWQIIRELETTEKYFSACAIPRGFLSFDFRQCFTFKESPELLDRINAEFDRKVKEKYSVNQIISPSGGEMNLLGCRLIFPPSAMDEETEVTLAVDSDPEDLPVSFENETSGKILSLDFPITPVMICKPSMKFNKPVTVEMNTCFSAREDKTIPVDIQIRKDDSGWKKVSEAVLGNTNKIRFTVSHFCGMAVTVSPELVKDGKFHLINDVYIQEGTAQISSVFCKDEITQRSMEESLQKANFVKFMGLSHEILEGLGTRVRLRFECTEPEQTVISHGYPSSQFDINRGLFEKRKHVVFFKPFPRPREYTGVIDADYYVKINEDAETNLIAAVEWPIQSKGTGPINISNVVHTGPRANVMATDNARVETHCTDGTNVVT